MMTKREAIGGLVGILLGAAATIGGHKADVVNLCSGTAKGVVAGETLKGDAGMPVDAGAAVDAGALKLTTIVDAGRIMPVPAMDASQ